VVTTPIGALSSPASMALRMRGKMPRPCGSNFGRRSIGVHGFRRRRQPFRYRGMKGRKLGLRW